MTRTPEPTTVGPHLRAAFGPGYQVPLDPARVLRVLPANPRRSI
jgi:hypothetical protein